MIISGEIELGAARARMRTPRAAMRKAMNRTPTAEPGVTLLEAADALATNLDTAPEVRIALGDVAEFIRSHSDIGLWAPLLGLSDGDVDALFRLAMQIEDE